MFAASGRRVRVSQHCIRLGDDAELTLRFGEFEEGEERGKRRRSVAYSTACLRRLIDKTWIPRKERSNCMEKEGKNEGLDLDVRGFSVVSEKVRTYSGLWVRVSR